MPNAERSRCKNRRMSDASDDETPFAHVPVPEAGPIPMQEGPFTWDKVAASIGRGSTRGTSPGAGAVVLLVLLAGVLVVLAALILR
jgi:hypothetical protein